MKLSIIIPAYNEESTIEAVVMRVLGVDFPLPFEVIVVSDGSTDRTPGLVEGFQDERVHLVHYNARRGKGFAIRKGIETSEGDIIVVQDADMEYDPIQIPVLVGPILEKKSHAVYGSRFMGEIRGMEPSYKLGNLLITRLTNLLFKSRLTDVETCYKAVPSEIARGLDLKQDGFEIEVEITSKLLKAGYSITEIPVVYSARRKEAGKKIGWLDGVKALYYLLKFRFSSSARAFL